MAGSVLLPVLGCGGRTDKKALEEAVREARTNWAGNYSYRAPHLHTPESLGELQELIGKLGVQKPLGSRHCFNDIADSPLNQVSTERLRSVIDLDRDAGEVTVEGGIRYGDLAPLLEAEGLALHNLASLPHISVVGACATATHGSGVRNGNLATAVKALELITPDGEILQITQKDPEFFGSVVHLGALGMVSRITLEVSPTFQVAQWVFLDLPLESAVENFEAILSGGYSVSLFTDWMDRKISQVWVKRRTDLEPDPLDREYFGARAADRHVHPIISLSAENCTPQMGEPGPWHERLPHFKMGFTPSSGDELQSEFFVPSEHAVEAFLALEAQRDRIYPHLQISEIRTVAKDDFWLSPAYGRDVVAFHFTWKPNGPEVTQLIGMIERELDPFSVVPHWGKLFSLDAGKLRGRYPKMPEFLDLVGKRDPEGRLQNAYLNRVLHG